VVFGLFSIAYMVVVRKKKHKCLLIKSAILCILQISFARKRAFELKKDMQWNCKHLKINNLANLCKSMKI
jgi:hypothetical protein